MMPPITSSERTAVTRRLLCWLADTALCGLTVAVVGCQGPNLAPARNGIGGTLSPTSVRQYAQQRGISDEQARYELQQKVSQHDEEQTIENIDQVGAKLP